MTRTLECKTTSLQASFYFDVQTAPGNAGDLPPRSFGDEEYPLYYLRLSVQK